MAKSPKKSASSTKSAKPKSSKSSKPSTAQQELAPVRSAEAPSPREVLKAYVPPYGYQLLFAIGEFLTNPSAETKTLVVDEERARQFAVLLRPDDAKGAERVLKLVHRAVDEWNLAHADDLTDPIPAP